MDEVATDHAAVLGRKLAALRDPVLRLGWAEDLLRRLSLDRAVALLGASLGEPGRDPQQDDLFLNLTLVLVQPALEERRRAIGAQALLHGPAEIGWLFGHRPDEGPAPAPQPVPDHGRGRPITLGERKSLARGRDRQLLARTGGLSISLEEGEVHTVHRPGDAHPWIVKSRMRKRRPSRQL